MDPLPRIPSPPGYWWREFRIKFLPAFGFLAVLAATVLMWKNYVAVPAVIGEAECRSADVLSTVPGLLAELNVDRFDCVTKDQILGRIFPLDPQQLTASAAAIEADLKLLKVRMDLDRARNAQSLAGLRTELELERLSLQAGQILLAQAEKEFLRAKKLAEDKVIPLGAGTARNDFGFEVALRDRDKLLAEVDSHKKAAAGLESAIRRLQTSGATEISGIDPLIEQSIAAQKTKLLSLEGPIELRSPIDGVVRTLAQPAGSRVMAGTPILTISPARPERIVGYLRAPLQAVPRPGDRVQVRTRGLPRQTAYSQVLRIGSDMQPFTAPMRVRGYDNSQERGLPFLVNVPADMTIYPGELVDLVIQH